VGVALQVIVSGLAAGGVLGVAAIALSLLYRLTGVVHLAFGALVGLSVFAALYVADRGAPGGGRADLAPLRFAAALAAGLVVSTAVGTLLYVVAIAPYAGTGAVAGWVAATAVGAFALRSVVALAFPRSAYVFPDPLALHRFADDGVWRIGDGVVPLRGVVVAIAAALLAGLADLGLRRTRRGRALRAIVDSREGAALAGVPVARLVLYAFALAGVLATVAAVLAAPTAPVTVDSGPLLGAKALAAAAVAGFATPWRSFAAGLGFGLVESVAANVSVGGSSLGDGSAAVVPLALCLLAVVSVAGRGRAARAGR
jgi:branched-subunit amino acid ABC-type transport system permease component